MNTIQILAGILATLFTMLLLLLVGAAIVEYRKRIKKEEGRLLTIHLKFKIGDKLTDDDVIEIANLTNGYVETLMEEKLKSK